ncbi:protein-tyrosine phosphatase family protein [Halostreptopolyspora alba]|uniref:Tyrosine specific protein phosphatases domain-containing protein n=1 Tax=Halostreptopolyspora alba TaxID=2487137 RepID=A0A3N0E1W0_9ACTN|nr:hypothetical protein EFW17_21330 [Nocardiopsaceae bacterium YIM 96095]
MPPRNSHTVTTPNGKWTPEDPRYDRAAGAWLGAAAMAHLVNAPPSMVAELAHPDSHGAAPARLAWLIDTALREVRTPATVTRDVTRPLERAWTRALRATVVEGRIPAPASEVGQDDPLSTAWRAVLATPVPSPDPAHRVFPCSHLVDTARAAHTAAGEEAAMYAGALAGARWGASAVPLRTHRQLADIVDPGPLVRRAVVRARGSAPWTWPEQHHHYEGEGEDSVRSPFSVAHPHDPKVVLANLSHMRGQDHADAVVSLCRIGTADIPTRVPARDRVEVWLADTDGANPNLHFVLDEAARTVAALRREGKRVLLHCAAGQSRTPAVAAHYTALAHGGDVVEALRTVIPVVGGHLDTPDLSRAVAALNGVRLAAPERELFPAGMPPRRAPASSG